MATNIDIASNALLLIGDNPISSFEDPGAGAQVAGNIYPETYKTMLAEHPWTFALKEQSLNLLSQSPDDLTNYQYAYKVPTDCIRIWAVMPIASYKIVGPSLYSNQTELLARYVYQVEETLLPSHFVTAFEFLLASKFAPSITESDSKSETMFGRHKDALAKAKNIDSQGQPQQPIIDSPFLGARRGGRSSLPGYGYLG